MRIDLVAAVHRRVAVQVDDDRQSRARLIEVDAEVLQDPRRQDLVADVGAVEGERLVAAARSAQWARSDSRRELVA